MLLAGDIGGTKTNLAVFSPDAGPRKPLYEATFPSDEFPSFADMILGFLAEFDVTIDRASFGVAGPVVDGQASVTNLSWQLDETHLADVLDISSVTLLNDLLSIGYAVPLLNQTDLHTLNVGKPSKEGAIAVVAPGTGLGEGYLTWDGQRYKAHPSEGGHASFSPTNDQQLEMLRYLQGRLGHVSVERVCAGIGIPNIYDYLKASGHAEEPDWLTRHLATTDDPTPVIVNTALDNDQTCKLCVATLDMFVSILGAEAGNLALKVLATGGVYLGGGIPPRIVSALEKRRFLAAFRNKGRFSDLLTDIPVHIILNPKAALLGAAAYGLAH